MKSYERKKIILEILEKEGKVNIKELAESLNVTRVTIRTDLDELEKRGFLVRTHGGAVIPEDQHFVRLITKTINENKKEKESIAKLASTLIEPGSTIMIDSGSTTAYLARYIKNMKLTVITNSMLILHELMSSNSVQLLASGGVLRKPSMAFIGGISRYFFEQLHADILFLGATGYSIDRGISCSNILEAETKKNMIKSALKVCFLADSSKSGKIAMAHICDWDEIDIFITDHITDKERSRLSEYGVEVMVSEAKINDKKDYKRDEVCGEKEDQQIL